MNNAVKVNWSETLVRWQSTWKLEDWKNLGLITRPFLHVLVYHCVGTHLVWQRSFSPTKAIKVKNNNESDAAGEMRSSERLQLHILHHDSSCCSRHLWYRRSAAVCLEKSSKVEKIGLRNQPTSRMEANLQHQLFLSWHLWFPQRYRNLWKSRVYLVWKGNNDQRTPEWSHWSSVLLGAFPETQLWAQWIGKDPNRRISHSSTSKVVPPLDSSRSMHRTQLSTVFFTTVLLIYIMSFAYTSSLCRSLQLMTFLR